MSDKYSNSQDVPLSILITRLDELSDAIIGGREKQAREFTMRIPAECDRDADLVLAEAARRLKILQAQHDQAIKEAVEKAKRDCANNAAKYLQNIGYYENIIRDDLLAAIKTGD